MCALEVLLSITMLLLLMRGPVYRRGFYVPPSHLTSLPAIEKQVLSSFPTRYPVFVAASAENLHKKLVDIVEYIDRERQRESQTSAEESRGVIQSTVLRQTVITKKIRQN